MRIIRALLVELSLQRRSLCVKLAIIAVLAVAFDMRFAFLAQVSGASPASLTWGDYLANMLAGIREYVFAPEQMQSVNKFSLPAAWVLLYCGICFVSLTDPKRELSGVESHLMVACGARGTWWVVRFMVSFVCVGASWATLCIATAAWTRISGGVLSLEVTELAANLLKTTAEVYLRPPWPLLELFGVAFLATLSLSAVQLLVSLILGPAVAFAVSASALFLSAFFLRSWLVGNYLMAARSSSFAELEGGGVDPVDGMILSGALLLGSFIGGLLVAKRLDSVGRRRV